MSGHTPGPWRVEEEQWHGVFSGKPFALYHIVSDTRHVAKVYERSDATLLAAAGDLLEACKLAERHLTRQIEYRHLEEDASTDPRDTLRNAIKRVEGS